MTERVPAEIVLRPARPTDAAALGAVGYRAFRMGTQEGWTAYYADNPHVPPGATLIAEIDGVMAGHATALDLHMSLAGRDVPMRGVAGVGVTLEHRRRGVADALMRGLLVAMRRRRQALSLLYPFKQAYYRRFGYELVEWFDQVRAPPALLPPAPHARHVRRFDVSRDGAAVKALYERTRASATGLLARSEYWWAQRIWKRSSEGVVWVDPAGGAVRGALLYDIPADPPYPRQQLHVRDLVHEGTDAYRGLLGFLAASGDQIRAVQLALPFGEALPLLSDRPDFPELPRGGIVEPAVLTSVGAMARLVDVAGAFALHPGPARAGVRGRLGLDLSDPVFPSQTGAFDVELSSRGARVQRGRTARERLTLGVDRLAQVYFAAVPAAQLLAQGLVTGSPRAAALLDRAFAGPRPFLGPANFF